MSGFETPFFSFITTIIITIIVVVAIIYTCIYSSPLPFPQRRVFLPDLELNTLHDGISLGKVSRQRSRWESKSFIFCAPRLPPTNFTPPARARAVGHWHLQSHEEGTMREEEAKSPSGPKMRSSLSFSHHRHQRTLILSFNTCLDAPFIKTWSSNPHCRFGYHHYTTLFCLWLSKAQQLLSQRAL